MKTIPVLTHYLEMQKKSYEEVEPPIDGVTFERVEGLTIEEYRSVYNLVGRPYGWFDRVLIEDEKLVEILKDPGTEIFLLKVNGEIAGYCELDRRDREDVELAFLALDKKFHRKGLGWFMLNKGLKEAWKEDTKRVWLHTCEWDHKGAIPMYQKAGFSIYDKNYHDQIVPDDFVISQMDP